MAKRDSYIDALVCNGLKASRQYSVCAECIAVLQSSSYTHAIVVEPVILLLALRFGTMAGAEGKPARQDSRCRQSYLGHIRATRDAIDASVVSSAHRTPSKRAT